MTAEELVGHPAPSLTRWQERRRRWAPLQRILMGALFLVLTVAMLVFFGAIVEIIAPVFGDGAIVVD